MRSAVAGWLLGAMLALAVAREFSGVVPPWMPGAAGWAAALLLWPRISRALQWQARLLIGSGLVAFGWGSLAGGSHSMAAMLTQNDRLLAMLAAVTFLPLMRTPEATQAPPIGAGAYLRTSVGVNLIGALINISGLVIVGDRLARDRPLGRREALLLCRSFCTAVFYSPFIGGMALALHHAPAASLPLVMLAGVPLAWAGLGYAYLEERRRDPERLAQFHGYPIRYESLWTPGLLALVVIVWHSLDPAVSVLTLISVIVPVVVGAVLVATRGVRPALHALRRHVRDDLPQMSAELALFLSAGVLAVGLSNALSALGGWMPVSALTGTSAAVIVCMTVAVSLVGVHPVVTLSAVVGVLAPSAPDPTLMVMMFVMAWGLGCVGNPFSGQILAIQARYGVDGWQFPRWNLGYCITLTAGAAIILHLYDVVFLG